MDLFIRNIVELGCGIGLTGLVICSSCSPCQYIFSDCHEDVLEAVQCNLRLNGFVPSLEQSQIKGTSISGVSRSTCRTFVESKSNTDEDLGELPLRNANASSLHLTNGNHDHTDHNKIAFLRSSELTNSRTMESDLQKGDGIPRCTACVSDYFESNGTSNQSRDATYFIAHFAQATDSCRRHLDEDCGKHPGSAHGDVCKLEWGTLKKSDLEAFSVGIILAAGMAYYTDLFPGVASCEGFDLLFVRPLTKLGSDRIGPDWQNPDRIGSD